MQDGASGIHIYAFCFESPESNHYHVSKCEYIWHCTIAVSLNAGDPLHDAMWHLTHIFFGYCGSGARMTKLSSYLALAVNLLMSRAVIENNNVNDQTAT